MTAPTTPGARAILEPAPVSAPDAPRRSRPAAQADAKLWIGALEVKVTQPPASAGANSLSPAAKRTEPRPQRTAPDRIARPFGGFGIRQS